MIAAVVLGLVAALLFASSASLQQQAARRTLRDAPAPGRLATALPVLRVVRSLVHDRVWLAGWLTNLTGFLTQAAALHLGSVALVQPLLVTQLMFSLPLSSLRSHRRPGVRDWASAAAVCAGVALVIVQQHRSGMSSHADRGRVLLALALAAVLVGLLLRIGASRRPAVHAAYAAVAAGVCFAMTAVMIKLTTDDLLHRGVLATAVDWPGYTLAATTLAGLLIEQEAFAAGALPTAIAGMSITNPVVSYGVAVLAFHEAAPSSGGALVLLGLAALLLGVGVIGLAHSPTVHAEVAQVPDRDDHVTRQSDPSPA